MYLLCLSYDFRHLWIENGQIHLKYVISRKPVISHEKRTDTGNREHPDTLTLACYTACTGDWLDHRHVQHVCSGRLWPELRCKTISSGNRQFSSRRWTGRYWSPLLCWKSDFLCLKPGAGWNTACSACFVGCENCFWYSWFMRGTRLFCFRYTRFIHRCIFCPFHPKH